MLISLVVINGGQIPGCSGRTKSPNLSESPPWWKKTEVVFLLGCPLRLMHLAAPTCLGRSQPQRALDQKETMLLKWSDIVFVPPLGTIVWHWSSADFREVDTKASCQTQITPQHRPRQGAAVEGHPSNFEEIPLSSRWRNLHKPHDRAKLVFQLLC